MKKNIGHKIRQIRELKGLSQEYMASQLNISQRAYSKMERDEIKLNWDKITDISQIFEMEPSDLVSFDDNLIFNNCQQSGKANYINNYLPEKLMEQYEEPIKHLEQEIEFLREMVGKE